MIVRKSPKKVCIKNSSQCLQVKKSLVEASAKFRNLIKMSGFAPNLH